MDSLLRLFFSVQLCSFSQKCPPKPNQRFDFFFQYLKVKTSWICQCSMQFDKFAIWQICNLKNDLIRRGCNRVKKNLYRLATTAKCGGDGSAAPWWCCSLLLLVILTAVSWLFPFPFSQEMEEGFTSAITSLLGSSESSSSHSFILGFNFIRIIY